MSWRPPPPPWTSRPAPPMRPPCGPDPIRQLHHEETPATSRREATGVSCSWAQSNILDSLRAEQPALHLHFRVRSSTVVILSGAKHLLDESLPLREPHRRLSEILRSAQDDRECKCR